MIDLKLKMHVTVLIANLEFTKSQSKLRRSKGVN